MPGAHGMILVWSDTSPGANIMSKELENEFDKMEHSAIAKRMLSLVSAGACKEGVCTLDWSPNQSALLGTNEPVKTYSTYHA